MTREEVEEILHYCKTKGITRKERLKELGIAPWRFYEYKARYAAEEMSGSIDGAFLQLTGNSEIVPSPHPNEIIFLLFFSKFYGTLNPHINILFNRK